MTDDLEVLIAAMVREAAHHHHCSIAEATRQIRALVAEACEEHRAAGASYGEDDQGFCRLPACASAFDAERIKQAGGIPHDEFWQQVAEESETPE